MRWKPEENTLSDIIRRFWSKVDIREINDCWVWTGAMDGSGYGQFGRRNNASLIFRYTGECRTSRIVYYITYGPIPPGLVVMHSCDNPPCCNPNHLKLGTHQDNQQDKKIKGRGYGARRGSENHRASLSEVDVIQIREWKNKGWKGRDIAEAFGVSEAAISLILSGKNWGWLK